MQFAQRGHQLHFPGRHALGQAGQVGNPQVHRPHGVEPLRLEVVQTALDEDPLLQSVPFGESRGTLPRPINAQRKAARQSQAGSAAPSEASGASSKAAIQTTKSLSCCSAHLGSGMYVRVTMWLLAAARRNSPYCSGAEPRVKTRSFDGASSRPSPSGDRPTFPDCSPAPFDGTAEGVLKNGWFDNDPVIRMT